MNNIIFSRNKKSTRKTCFFILLLSVIISLLMGIEMVDRVSVLLILYVCIRLGMRETSLVNPFFLFSVTPLSLLIYVNVGDFYMMDLSHRTWLIAILNMAAFVAALMLTPAMNNKGRDVILESKDSETLNIILLFAVSFLGSLIEPLASILWIFAVPAIVLAIKSKRIKMFVIVGIYILLSYIGGMLSKMTVLMLVMTFLISYDKYYAVTSKQKKRVLIASALGLVLMLGAFSFANKDRGKYDAGEGLASYSNQGVEWTGATGLFMPYMYLTTSWTNLQYVMETQDSRTYGLWLAKPLLGYLQMDDNFKNEYHLESYSSFNTFGFITCGFKDFGYWLSIISSLLLGFYVKKVYSRYLLRKSPFDVACYVLVGLATVELFFSNHFFMQSYPFTILIEMELYKLFFKTKRIS